MLAAAQKWRSLAKENALDFDGRDGHSLVAVDNALLLFGGRNSNMQQMNDMFRITFGALTIGAGTLFFSSFFLSSFQAFQACCIFFAAVCFFFFLSHHTERLSFFFFSFLIVVCLFVAANMEWRVDDDGAPAAAVQQPWACDVCTFAENAAFSPHCSLCGEMRSARFFLCVPVCIFIFCVCVSPPALPLALPAYDHDSHDEEEQASPRAQHSPRMGTPVCFEFERQDS